MTKVTCLVLAILLPLCLGLVGCSKLGEAELQYRRRQTLLTDEAISKSSELQQLNAVCTAVRLPADFAFVSKGGLDDEKISLAYQYKSDTPFETAKSVFEGYFKDMTWTETDRSDRYPRELHFTNGSYLVNITFLEKYSLSNYGIYCEKLR